MEEQISKVKAACEKYGFNCHESINGVFIRTVSLAGWYILLTGDKPKLLHENYRHVHKYGKGIMEGYHEHPDVREDTADGMVEYIRAHDIAMMKKKKEKNPFDQLKIEKTEQLHTNKKVKRSK